MAWAGGTFTRANGANEWVTDFNNGVGIEPARHDTQDNDLATGINQCLNKDGSNSMTGNLNLNNNIPTNIGAGTAAAPAICAGGDVNTGVFAPAADTWAVATNGTEKVRIDSSGRVGIGTTTPTETLSIVAPAAGNGAISLRGNNNAAASEFLVSQATDGATTYVYNRANGPLVFGTNNLERLRIVAGGNVGIGQGSPSALLHVGSGASQTVVTIQGSTSGSGGGSAISMPQGVLGNISAVDGGAYNAGMKLRSYGGGLTLTADSGGFGITGLAGSTGGSAMKVNTANGQWFYDTSAQRYKENIRTSAYGLETVLTLQPRQYNYIFEGKPEDVGFIAEEIDPILPFLVAKNKDGACESITYDRFTAILVKAVQELNEKVEALEARVAELER